MPVSEKDYFEALRASDQRAIELLATSNADRIKTWQVITSIFVSITSSLVAVGRLHGLVKAGLLTG